MIINFNKAAILKGQPITPGWYKVMITKIGKPEISGDRIDQPITMAFEADHLKIDDRDIDYTFYNCATKGQGFVISLWAALEGKTRQELAEGVASGTTVPFDFDNCLGKKLQIKLINTEFEGRPQNKIESFVPYDKEIAL